MYVYIYIYMWPKTGCWGLTTWKSIVCWIYCLLIEFNRQKRSLLRQVIRSGKGIWRHSINATEKGFLENCITLSHASYNLHAAIQCRPTISLQVQSVLMLSTVWQCLVCTGYVFCETLVVTCECMSHTVGLHSLLWCVPPLPLLHVHHFLS